MPAGSITPASARQLPFGLHRSGFHTSVGGLVSTVALTWMLVSLLAPRLALGSTGDSAQHLYLQINYDGQAFHLVSSRVENAPLPGARGASEAAPPKGPWRVTLRDAKGEVLWEDALQDPTMLRGEFADDSKGTVKHASHTRRLPASFLLRTPAVASGTLHFAQQVGDQTVALGSLEVSAHKTQGAP